MNFFAVLRILRTPRGSEISVEFEQGEQCWVKCCDGQAFAVLEAEQLGLLTHRESVLVMDSGFELGKWLKLVQISPSELKAAGFQEPVRRQPRK